MKGVVGVVAISFIGAKSGNSNSDFNSYTGGFTPLATGLAAGDVAVLAVSSPTDTSGSPVVTGWTQVYEGLDVVNSGHRASVWYHVVLSTDTDTTGYTFDNAGEAAAEGFTWVSCTYRGVDVGSPFLVEDGAFSDTDLDRALASPTVNNTNPAAWWVSAGASSETLDTAGDATVTWTASAGTERGDIDSSESTSAHSAAMYDSNGVIATGDYSVTHTLGSTTTTPDLISWIGILRPLIVHRSGLFVTQQAIVRASVW